MKKDSLEGFFSFLNTDIPCRKNDVALIVQRERRGGNLQVKPVLGTFKKGPDPAFICGSFAALLAPEYGIYRTSYLAIA